jgi:capsular exopolysaccharide synthesis family protein
MRAGWSAGSVNVFRLFVWPFGQDARTAVASNSPMSSRSDEMTLRDYSNVVVRRRWIVIGSVVLCAVVATALTALQTPVYSASSEVLVQPRGQDGLFEDTVINVNERSIQTEIQVIEGQAVRDRVQRDLGLNSRPPAVSASAVGQTDVIALAVRDANAANAAIYANAYARAYIDVRREQSVNELLAASAEVQESIDGLQAQLDSLGDDDPRRPGLSSQLANFSTTLDQLRVDAALRTGGAAVIKSAETPSSPVEPTPARTVTLAAVVGLLLGLGAAFLIDYLDDKVRSEDDLEALTDRPVLSVVPVDPPPDNRPISISEPTHTAVEAYRGLRTNLQFLGLDRSIRVVQLTSSMAGEGKTTTSTNLAVVLAQAGHRVALVDADLRRPRVHEVFDIPQTPGFTDLLLGMDAKQVVNHVDIDGGNRLSVYTSGTIPSNPSEMLSGRRVRQLLNEMGGHYDYVVVDSAPVLPVSDSVALAGSVDGLLVVAHAGRVTQPNVVETLERLERIGAPILGLVLNQATQKSKGYYAYGGYGSPPPSATSMNPQPGRQEPVDFDRSSI